MNSRFLRASVTSAVLLLGVATVCSADDPQAEALAEIGAKKVGAGDWPQWAGWTHKNNVSSATGILTEFDVESGEGVIYKVPLGSQTYGNVVVANGNLYVGTNNHHENNIADPCN